MNAAGIVDRLMLSLASVNDERCGDRRDALIVVSCDEKPFFELLRSSSFFRNIYQSYFSTDQMKSREFKVCQADDMLLLATAKVCLVSHDPHKSLVSAMLSRVSDRLRRQKENPFCGVEKLEVEQQFFKLIIDKVEEENR